MRMANWQGDWRWWKTGWMRTGVTILGRTAGSSPSGPIISVNFQPLLNPGGAFLDVACGSGGRWPQWLLRR
jgi:hypothetical protein